MAGVRAGRARRTAAIGMVAAAVGLTASCAAAPANKTGQYCAVMSDSVGLYVDNPVTQMGYEIGRITDISPHATDVRVAFELTEPRRLPRDVKAVTRSISILADRSLELVGNPDSGPALAAGECIPLSRSFTPKTLSEVIGSAASFIDTIHPEDSENIGDVVRSLDQALHANGGGINELLTTSSTVVDSPDQAISDMGSITSNLAELTSLLAEMREPVKEILLNARENTWDVANSVEGGSRVLGGTIPLVEAAGDLENYLGESIQFMLDETSFDLRKMSTHAPWLANLMNPVPWWINTVANHYNSRPFHITYRPPMYRIRTPDGLALCGVMNASAPGSCADVAGEPYAVDVALLQYVLTEASR